MSCLGVHFAITESQASALRAISDESKRLDFVRELEEQLLSGDKRYAAESDKSWDALHRVMGDGTLDDDGGSYPLNHLVLGGESLYTDDDYIMSLKQPTEVKDIARVIVAMDMGKFRERYYQIDQDDYDAELSEDDLDYTWSWFQGIRELFVRADRESLYVLFTADQ